MRILFIVRSIGYGGASKQLALTANAMAMRGHEVYIYSYCWNDLMQDLASGVTYIPQNDLCKGKIAEYIYSPLRIRRIIRKTKCQIAISWRANAGCFTSLACIGLKNVTHIYSERTDPYTETSLSLKLATSICKLADGGVFQTKKACEYYGRKLAERSVIIPNPVNTDLHIPNIIPLSEREKAVAWVGRFAMKQKRMDIMIEAWKLFYAKHDDWTLHFYGDGNAFEQVKSMVMDAGLENNVLFHGAIKGIIEHICNKTMLVMSSDYEGIPNTIIEAFVAGVPVVTTDCSPGGARILIDHGANGLISPTGDYQALSQNMDILANDIKLQEQFIIASRQKLSEFAPDILFEQWEKYLKTFVE